MTFYAKLSRRLSDDYSVLLSRRAGAGFRSSPPVRKPYGAHSVQRLRPAIKAFSSSVRAVRIDGASADHCSRKADTFTFSPSTVSGGYAATAAHAPTRAFVEDAKNVRAKKKRRWYGSQCPTNVSAIYIPRDEHAPFGKRRFPSSGR